MKQIGNLAIVCAPRKDVTLHLQNGMSTVYIGSKPNQTVLSFDWSDDEKITELIYELNHGQFKVRSA